MLGDFTKPENECGLRNQVEYKLGWYRKSEVKYLAKVDGKENHLQTLP
jgi:hypothetical protein